MLVVVFFASSRAPVWHVGVRRGAGAVAAVVAVQPHLEGCSGSLGDSALGYGMHLPRKGG
jgi:hypothetical protein